MSYDDSGILAVLVPINGLPSPAGVWALNGTVRGIGLARIRMLADGTVEERVHAYSNGGPGIVVGDDGVIDSFAILNSGAGIIGMIVRATWLRITRAVAFSCAPAAWRVATPPGRMALSVLTPPARQHG